MIFKWVKGVLVALGVLLLGVAFLVPVAFGIRILVAILVGIPLLIWLKRWLFKAASEPGWFRDLMMLPWTGRVGAVAGVVLVAAVIWWGNPLYLMMALVPAFYATVAGVLMLAAAAWRRSWESSTLKLGAMMTACLPVMLVARELNRMAYDHAVAEVKAYQVKAAPLLEAYRAAHRRYPEALTELQGAPELPRLLRRRGYRSWNEGEAASYSMSVIMPAEIFCSWDYRRDTNEWVLNRD